MPRGDQSEKQLLPFSTKPPEVHIRTVWRMNLSIGRREPVCRNLFGPVDHERLRRDLKQKLQEITEQDSRRWNFNFQTDTPLPGRFQWEPVAADLRQDAALCAPNAERKEEDVDEEEEEEESAATNQENCSSVSNTDKCPAEVTPVRRKRTLSKPPVKPRSNARITDFFVKRKRMSGATKSITSSSEAALCKTIR